MPSDGAQEPIQQPAPIAPASEAEERGGGILSIPHRRNLTGSSKLSQLIEDLSYGVAWLTTGLAFVLTVGLFGCILLQVFFRYVLNAPLSWTDETAILLFAWIMLLLASLCVRERIHARFTALINALPAGVALLLDKATMLLMAAFGCAFVYVSFEMLDLVWGNRSPAINYPLQLLYFAVPVHGVFIVIHAVTNIFVGPNVSFTRKVA